ncbi:hypothetical protein BJ138DRAFT_539372 [Hygrophoropsis aurantiaca]|uniref:Uncharacterized protein n=1 Tax=Hygrophoropsis aurantiaca TaxID=72124 RepID=A0ACB8AKQ7_9AGAM|nr:hypothetical protein BJ138DRAFT_539372 [Hygrophoropsis aurantiaca]
MVKKRKDPPKAGTLLDFFSNSTPAKKGKLSTPTQMTTTRRKENLKLKVGVASSIPSTREVIVIDSESDDDVIVCDTTKTKGKAPDSANRPVKGKTVANTARVKSYEERVSFGEPTALLLPTANPASIEFSLRQSPCRAESNGSTMFGAAGSLLSSAGPTIVSNAPLAQTKDAVTDSFQHAADESNTIHIMDVDGEQSLPPDSLNISCTQDEVEEWGVDDEEQAALQAFDEDIDMEIIDEQLATPCGIESTTCPICRRDLSNMISLVCPILNTN